MGNNRIYILLISLGISAIVMMWDSSEEILTPPRVTDQDFEQFPYAVVDNASTRYFDTGGNLDYSFTADKLEHFRVEARDRSATPEEYTLIHGPNIVIHEEEDPWHVEADNGKLVRMSEEITLWDNVRIWQTTPRPAPVTPVSTTAVVSALSDTSQLYTTFLTIDAVQKVAHTEEPVKITSPYGEIDAVGMTADFRERKIQLHKGVRAVHKIPPQQARQ